MDEYRAYDFVCDKSIAAILAASGDPGSERGSERFESASRKVPDEHEGMAALRPIDDVFALPLFEAELLVLGPVGNEAERERLVRRREIGDLCKRLAVEPEDLRALQRQ